MAAEPMTTAKLYAAVWIDPDRAIVARTTPTGEVEIQTLGSNSDPVRLATVSELIGEVAEVLVMGPDASRLALEREYVWIFRRPERIVDVRTAVPPTPAQLESRLRSLAAPLAA